MTKSNHSFRIPHSLCIVHCALCIALAFAAANARAAVPADYSVVAYVASSGVLRYSADLQTMIILQ